MSLTQILTSMHGRRFGLSSSGGVLVQPTSSTGMTHLAEISSAGVFNSSITNFGSTITEMTVAAMKTVIETISSSAATLVNYGMSVISSDVINGSVLTISAPVANVEKTVWGDSSASTITFNTTAVSILFNATLGSSSSALVWDRAGSVRGSIIRMVGLSATRWAILDKTAVA